jgi:lipopolysaccharide assembly outer membrane protein LptD (OstA)
LGAQCLIFFLNQKPLTKNFSQKNITVENFSSIVLSKSGITKIGSEKLNKIDEDNIYLEGNSYLENKEYKIYGKNISINLSKEISKSDENVEVINNMGLLKAQGFKNLDYDGKIFFEGEVEFVINK